MEPLTTVGALVSTTKAVVETVKTLRDLLTQGGWGTSSRAKAEVEKVSASFATLQKRLNVLADQLQKSAHLVSMVETWLQIANRMPLQSIRGKSDEEIEHIHNELSHFLHQSTSDFFSSAFQTRFHDIPTVQQELDSFNTLLGVESSTVSSIRAQNVRAIRSQWEVITTQFHTLCNAGQKVQQAANRAHFQLIEELRQAAAQGVSS
jgi:hypothetical protein